MAQSAEQPETKIFVENAPQSTRRFPSRSSFENEPDAATENEVSPPVAPVYAELDDET
jgi:hypothetical protein